MTSPLLSAVILAAGASTRMGSSKAQLEFNQRTFVDHCVDLATRAGCAPIVVVDGAHPLRPPPEPAVLRHNKDWRRGPLSSLQCGLRACLERSPETPGLLVLTVDRPHLRAQSVRDLTTHFHHEPCGLWQARHRSKSGHPIIYPAHLFAALLALPSTNPQVSARDLVRAATTLPFRRYLELDDPAVTQNIDRPRDLRLLPPPHPRIVGGMDLSPIEALHPRWEPDLGLLCLELDHGKANEVGRTQLDAFASLCDLVESRDEIRTVCTTSRRRSRKGKPLFIAGANVQERSDWTAQEIENHVAHQRELMQRLRRLPAYTIALPSGSALGWGCEYLLCCDLVLATGEASFALPETSLGIVPGAGGTAHLAASIGVAQALRLGCTGETIDTEEALRIGLVHAKTPSVDEGLQRVQEIARAVSRRSPTAVAQYKRAVLDGLGQPAPIRLELESQAYQRSLDNGDAAVGRENFRAILNGDVPSWPARRL